MTAKNPLLPVPTAADVVALQAYHDYPAVSVLCTTDPAPAASPEDLRRLRGLVADACARVGAELGASAADRVGRRLDQLLGEVARQATGRAVALFVGEHHASVWSLPVVVVDRVVVDPSFATRDLVRALHRTPRHVVLVLTSRDARLFEGVADTLTPATHHAFPLQAEGLRKRNGERAGAREVRGRGDGHVEFEGESFLREVDEALGTYLRLRPAPLVLIGPPRSVGHFRRISKNLDRLAGAVHGGLARATVPTLTAKIRPVLESYLRSREADALALLERRSGSDRVVEGMAAVWLSARAERPEMLAVEEGLFFPARLSADGDFLEPAADVEHPEVIDDAVDEVIELVLRRGGWVALLGDGALADRDRIALTLRQPPRIRR